MGLLSFVVSTPGKIILHGEHSVVYGKTALAGSLNLRTCVTLKENGGKEERLTLSLPKVSLEKQYNLTELKNHLHSISIPLLNDMSSTSFSLETPELIDLSSLLELLHMFLKQSADSKLSTEQENSLLAFFCLYVGMLLSVNIELEPFTVFVDTDLSIGAGVGSSASFSVSLAATFFQYIRTKVASKYEISQNISRKSFKPAKLNVTNLTYFNDKEKDLISRWAFLNERIMHGNPSGIDNMICTYGSVIEYRKNSGIKKLPGVDLWILLVDTGISRNTASLVERVAEKKRRFSQVIDAVLDALDGVALSASALIGQLASHSGGDELNLQVGKLEELVDMNQALLMCLDISHPSLNRICNLMSQYGLHGKLTGAGGGGFAFSLLPPGYPDDKLDQLLQHLAAEGFKGTQTRLGGAGVSVKQI
uniref:Mevalonate kinase n=1 Tax=Timema shepardi TaxID=629360 RepID=A0A7R9B609_TIMSH|nr:unnamed protein product [Timema shepardi]